MKRRLVAVPDLSFEACVADVFNECLAKDVIDGIVIHNVETDEFCRADAVTREFREEAIAAYKRLLDGERA